MHIPKGFHEVLCGPTENDATVYQVVDAIKESKYLLRWDVRRALIEGSLKLSGSNRNGRRKLARSRRWTFIRLRLRSFSGLSAKTRYWYDVLCTSTNYRRGGVFITQ